MDFYTRLQNEITNAQDLAISAKIELSDIHQRTIVLETRLANYAARESILRSLLKSWEEEYK